MSGKPFYIGKHDSVRVPLYRNRWKDMAGKLRTGYIVKYRIPGRKKPVQIKRTDLAKAKAAADDAAKEIATGNTAKLQFKDGDAAIWARVCAEAQAIGKNIETILAEYKQAIRHIPSWASVETACQDFGRRNSSQVVPATMSQLVPKFLAQIRADNPNLSGKYLEDMEDRLNAAARYFVGPIHQLTAADFSEWLRDLRNQRTGQPLSASTRVSLLLRLSVFFNHEIARAHLPADWDELSQKALKRPKVIRAPIDIFTIEELTRLLYGAAGLIALPTPEAIELDPSLGELSAEDRKQIERQKDRLRSIVPYLALGAFGSTRNDFENGEVSELDWSHINFTTRQIDMDDGKGKVGDRYIPMPENLVEWLLPFAKTTGRVIPAGARKRRELLCRLVGVKWKWNGLRRSCISYRQALIKNVEEVAADAGNSPQMVNQRYRKAVPHELGERWSNIRPPTEGKIVALSKTHSKKLQNGYK